MPAASARAQLSRRGCTGLGGIDAGTRLPCRTGATVERRTCLLLSGSTLRGQAGIVCENLVSVLFDFHGVTV